MTASLEGLKRTPLYEAHRRWGGKLVPFAGYAMPVQYRGILHEHAAVRERVGLFDVSHMGRLEIRGSEALPFLERVTVNHVAALALGQAQYTALLNEKGGIIDDCVLYRAEDHYLLVMNAANHAKDVQWLEAHRPPGAEMRDLTERVAQLALQGPRAQGVLQPMTEGDLEEIGFYWCACRRVSGIEALVARTGYTGEDGFEIYIAAGEAERLWEALLVAGEQVGIEPCGLGARDTLRLEMKYCLYGNDIDETTTPLEAGLGWITKLDKGGFIGRAALLRQKEEGLARRLVGFRLLERGIPRPGYPLEQEGRQVGQVASGTISPNLGIGIGTAYLPPSLAREGTSLAVDARGKLLPAQVVRTPFYTLGSHR